MAVIKGTKQSCYCVACKKACQHKPGWFLPGEAERVADYLKLSLKELFKTKLLVDWWADDPDIFLLSPAIVGKDAGVEFSTDPRGTCVFFKNGLCAIHNVKPAECTEMIHGQKADETLARHEQIGKLWQPHQDQIKRLLGRKPKSGGAFSVFDQFV